MEDNEEILGLEGFNLLLCVLFTGQDPSIQAAETAAHQ